MECAVPDSAAGEFLWLGAFIMAVGGAIAATDRRYRMARQAAAAPVATPGVAGEHAG